MSTFKDFVYKQNADLCEVYSDKIDLLEVMIEMMGYEVDILKFSDHDHRVYFEKDTYVMFGIIFYENIVSIIESNNEKYEKYGWEYRLSGHVSYEKTLDHSLKLAIALL